MTELKIKNHNLPVGTERPSEDEAAGDELREDGGAEALRSSEQSGLSGSFSILAHYFPTSSASFHTLDLDFEQNNNNNNRNPPLGTRRRYQCPRR